MAWKCGSMGADMYMKLGLRAPLVQSRHPCLPETDQGCDAQFHDQRPPGGARIAVVDPAEGPRNATRDHDDGQRADRLGPSLDAGYAPPEHEADAEKQTGEIAELAVAPRAEPASHEVRALQRAEEPRHDGHTPGDQDDELQQTFLGHRRAYP